MTIVKQQQPNSVPSIKILVVIGILTAVCSALLDNVTTVLLVVPAVFSITKLLEITSMPYLFTVILTSNIGGTATLISDPPNIMIGSAVKELTFAVFVNNLSAISFFIT